MVCACVCALCERGKWCVWVRESEEGPRKNSNRGGWSRMISWEISLLQLNQVINETWIVLGFSSLFWLVVILSLNCRNWNVYRNTPAFHEGKFEKRSVIMQISALVSQRGGPRLVVTHRAVTVISEICACDSWKISSIHA